MPTFEHPWFLLLLPLVPLLLWWHRSRGVTAIALPTAPFVQGLPSRRARRYIWANGILLNLAGVCLVAAISGPRVPGFGPRLGTEGISLVLVVDVSASMATEDFRWGGKVLSRLAGVQQAFRLLIAGGESPDGVAFAGRPQDLVGLVTFGTRPETSCPLTLDHGTLLHVLDRQRPRTLVFEATTNPGDALAWALEGLRHAPTRHKVLVLLTDGESNVPPPALTPLQAGQLAAHLGISVHTLDALAESDTSPDAGRARETLQDLARLTGGRYFRAGDGPSLVHAAEELDRLERDRLLDFASERHFALAPWLALAAFGSWFLLLCLQATSGRALP